MTVGIDDDESADDDVEEEEEEDEDEEEFDDEEVTDGVGYDAPVGSKPTTVPPYASLLA